MIRKRQRTPLSKGVKRHRFRAALLLVISILIVTSSAKFAAANWLTDLFEADAILNAASKAKILRTAEEIVATAKPLLSERAGAYLVSIDHTRAGVVVFDGKNPLGLLTPYASLADTLSKAHPAEVFLVQGQADELLTYLDKMPTDIPLRLLLSDMSILEIEHKLNEGKSAFRVRINDAIYMRVSKDLDLETARRVADRFVMRSNMRFYSLVDPAESDAIKPLNDALGDIHAVVKPNAIKKWLDDIRYGGSRIHFVLGHYSGDEFVVLSTSSQVLAKIPVRDIEMAAAKSHSTVLLLGCNSGFGNATGFLSRANSLAIASELDEISRGGRVGDLLEALSRSAPGGYSVGTSTFDDIAYVLDASLAEAEVPTKVFAISRVRYIEYVDSLTEGNFLRFAQREMQIPTLTVVFVFWGVGAVLLILNGRHLWFIWDTLFPGRRHRLPILDSAAYTSKCLAFITVAPLFLASLRCAPLLLLIPLIGDLRVYWFISLSLLGFLWMSYTSDCFNEESFMSRFSEMLLLFGIVYGGGTALMQMIVSMSIDASPLVPSVHLLKLAFGACDAVTLVIGTYLLLTVYEPAARNYKVEPSIVTMMILACFVTYAKGRIKYRLLAPSFATLYVATLEGMRD